MPNEQQFIEIIEANKGIIYKIANAYYKVRDDRNDLAQEIIFQLWRSFGKYNETMKFSTWMYRVALNTAISFYRKDKNRKNNVPITEAIFTIKDDAGNIEHEYNLQLLQQFINELNELDKALILLYLDERPQKEIAEIFGLSETNISTKIARIKNKLKNKFNKLKN